MRVSDIPTKKKWWIFLGYPLVTGVGAYFFRAIIEVGWPPLSAAIGMTIGFFIASSLIGILKPKWAMQEKVENPTRFQKIGRSVFYTLLAGIFLFYFIRFFILL